MNNTARTSAWYDQFYQKARCNPKQEYSLDPTRCVYGEMWSLALGWIGDDERIIDIGCGPGQFAQLAIRNGKYYGKGIDFSREAIVWARERNPAHAAAFDVCDFSTTQAIPDPYDVAVVFEVLEHVKDDLGLLAKLRRGSHVVLSVPSYGFTSHLRHFSNPGLAKARYAPLLTLTARHSVSMRAGKRIWLFNGVRK